MRIPFAIAVRDPIARTRSATVTTCVTMSDMDALDMEIQAAAKKRTKAEEAFKRADEELRALLVKPVSRAISDGPRPAARPFTRSARSSSSARLKASSALVRFLAAA